MDSKLCEKCILYDFEHSVGDIKEGRKKKAKTATGKWPIIRSFQEWSDRPECSFCRLIAKVVRGNGNVEVPAEAYCSVRQQNAFIFQDAGVSYGGIDYLELRVTAWRDDPFLVGDSANKKYMELLLRPLDTSESKNKMLHSRPVTSKVDTKLLQSWLQLCLETHRPMENHHFSAGGDSFVPQVTKFSIRPLVIDVKEKCIVELPDSARYSTLSYVWGSYEVPQLKLLRENRVWLQKRKSLNQRWEHVPNTIKDAISLCADLDVPYLWVDALCIVQDDVDIMAKTIADMGNIYSNSVFNIVAASGKDSWAGLAGRADNARKIFQYTEKLGDITLVNALPDFEAALDRSMWTRRGWTLQEGLLAPILIIFTDSQVFFHCNHSLLTEDLIAEAPLSKEVHYITGQKTGSAPEENILRQLHKPSLQRETALPQNCG